MRREKTNSFMFIIVLLIFSGINLIAQSDIQPENVETQKRLEILSMAKPVTYSNAVKGVDDYCIPGGQCDPLFGDNIEDFSFAGIQNLGSGCSANGYGDFTNMQGTAEIGQTYTATFKVGNDYHAVCMWIDFNDDEVFSEYELVLDNFPLDLGGVSYDTEITIPSNASPGIHRLRIGSAFGGNPWLDPCYVFNYGEWEDYSIEVTGNPQLLNAMLSTIDTRSTLPQGNVIPKATVVNTGIETISFPVTMTESTTGYSSTVQVIDLPLGGSTQVEFDPWSAEVGDYTIEVCANLTGDENPDDDCLTKIVAFSDHSRQKVLAELFTGTWCANCPYAEIGLHTLSQDYPDSLVIIAWHIGSSLDPWEFQGSIERVGYMGALGFPTVWFSGFYELIGASPPSAYPVYLPVMQEDVIYPSNFEINMEITNANNNDYNVTVTTDILIGNNTENLAGFVVLTESGLIYEGDHYDWVARKVWPDGNVGTPLDFSVETSHTWNTVVTLENNYVYENCEVVVFIQNMDTKEIYQANSMMMTEITDIADNSLAKVELYPNPANNRLTINSPEVIKDVMVYNQVGQLIKQFSASSKNINLNVSNLKQGVYIFKVFTEKGLIVKQVVIT